MATERAKPNRASLRRLTGYLARTDGKDGDRLLYDRVRLAIMSILAVHEVQTFSELKTALGMTDGNLGTHARKLEDVDYIACRKRFEGRVPRSEYRLTARGRRAFDRYLAHMDAIMEATRREP